MEVDRRGDTQRCVCPGIFLLYFGKSVVMGGLMKLLGLNCSFKLQAHFTYSIQSDIKWYKKKV